MKESIKIVVTGSCGCGKTSIISRLVSESFSDEYISTEGGTFHNAEFIYHEFQGQKLKMEVWDTAGQEKYKALTKLFYKNSNAVVLVYDTTNKDSYNDLKEYWYNQVKECVDEDISKIILYYMMYIYSTWCCWE